jgi:hypothetical protein
MLIAAQGDAADRAAGGWTCVVWRQAAAAMFFFEQVQVRRHLACEIGLVMAPCEK